MFLLRQSRRSAVRCWSPTLFTKLAPLIEAEIGAASDVLAKLVERLNGMGLGDALSEGLDGDTPNLFFEFQLAPYMDSA